MIVDAVVHPYDLGPDNWPVGDDIQLRALHPFHVASSGRGANPWTLTGDEFFTDFDPEAMTAALFAESPVDMAIIHALPNLGFTRAGVTDVGRMAALRDRHPGRFLLYATVDSPVTDVAIKQLESSFAYILSKPRRFADMVGALLAAAGPDRLLFGSGVNLVHPRPLLDAFAAFEMPDDWAPLTEEIRGKILGGNALRLHGLDDAEIPDDHFQRQKAAGFAPYWSGLRS